MATGFISRFKGKIAIAWGAIWQSGVQSSAVLHNAGAPSNGSNGTFAGIAGPGALMVDTTNKAFYQNTGSLSSPTWTALTTATGAGTYTGTFDGVVGGTSPAAASVTTLAVSGLQTESSATGLTASTTQTRTGALALTKQVNILSTVANSGDAVSLPTASVGLLVTIFNKGAHPASVFPAGASDTIDGGSGGAAVTLTNAKNATFYCTAANTWISAQGGVASA